MIKPLGTALPCRLKSSRRFVWTQLPYQGLANSSKFLTGVRLSPVLRIRVSSRSKGRLECKALVNVDVLSPSVLLGVGLIGSGVTLTTIRTSKPWISKDSDVFLSSMLIVTGGALIFQGWRLDPLLLLCQLMTCGVAITFALEALSLRVQNKRNEPLEPTRERSQGKDKTDYDEFVYDYDDPSFDPSTSPLPYPRGSYTNYLSDESESDDQWAVDDYTDDPYDFEELDTSKKPQKKTPSPNSGSLQTIEDWE